jgi:hypothetical protein
MAVDDSAQVPGSDNRVFHGREATVRIGDAIRIGPDQSDDLSRSEFESQSLKTTFDEYANGNDRSGIITEITLTDPEATVEIQDTFGGQVMTESPHEAVEIEFTARFQDRSFIEEITGAGNSIDVNGEFTRVSGGTQIGSRPNRAILFRLEKDGDIINYLMNNAIFQQMGEISLAGDDAAEITGTALCRVADRDVEDNFS